VLNSKKEIRIIKERSHWNYNFLVRPDLLSHDYETLSKLGYNLTFNYQSKEDLLAAMIYVFDFFARFGVVNLCMDAKTHQELRDRDYNSSPQVNLANLLNTVQEMGKQDDDFVKYGEKHNQFLDGLLDLHQKYGDLYRTFGDQKYQRRAQKAKTLWLKRVQR
jgi:hypothetical protein